MPLGQSTTDTKTRVSTREELLKAARTSGLIAPVHTPEVAAQTYTDIETGIVHEWWSGAWHAS